VAGTNNGGRFTGVSLSNVTYHVFLIFDPTTNVIDVGFDTSVTAANRPSGWVARRLGSILRVSGSILEFIQVGNRFLLKTVSIDLNSVSVPNTDTLYTLTVPQGLSVITESLVSGGLAGFGSVGALEIRSPAKFSRVPNSFQGDIAFTGIGGSLYTGDGIFWSSLSWIRFLTNTSGQLIFNYSSTFFTVDYGVTVQTHGWQDIQLNNGV
jgi:hypothetical protein